MVVFGRQRSRVLARMRQVHVLAMTLVLTAGLGACPQTASAQYAPQPPSPGAPPQPDSPQQPGGYGQPRAQSADQNGRAARLTYLAGDVHIDSAAGSNDEPAALNMAIVEGMVVATGDNGQAEIEFEDGSLVRLTPNSAVSLLNLSIGTSGVFETRLALLPGLSYLELRSSSKYQFSIDAGGDVISPVENSAVRVDFDETPAKIAVLDGSIRVVSHAGISATAAAGQTLREETTAAASPNQSQNAADGGRASRASAQTQLPATVYGQGVYGQGVGGHAVGPDGASSGGGSDSSNSSSDGGQAASDRSQGPIVVDGQSSGDGQATGQSAVGDGRFVVKDSLEPNSWDQWNEDRDQAAASDASNQTDARNGYAGDQGYGWSDLDSNGSWYDIPGQGQVWQPDAATQSGDDAATDPGADSFDPYGYGDWVFTAGYGYVWASGYPWGWTPYRCGAWGYYGGFGWGWSPGAACGLPAYGGRGYRRLNLNQRLVPLAYHPPSKPGGGRDFVNQHPVVIVNGGLAPAPPPHVPPVTRSIAHHTVQPLAPRGGGYTPQGGSAVGSALLRDTPIDRATHTAIAGVLPSSEAPPLSASNYVASTWHPVGRPTSHMVPALGRTFSYSPRSSNGQPGSRSGTTQFGSQTGSHSFGQPQNGENGANRPGANGPAPARPRLPYESGRGAMQLPQTVEGAPVYRTYPTNPAYRPPSPVRSAPGSYPARPEGTTAYQPSYRQPPAPPVQRATPPPSRPAATPASTGPPRR